MSPDRFVLVSLRPGSSAEGMATLAVPDEPTFLTVGRTGAPRFTRRPPRKSARVAPSVVVAQVQRRVGPRLLVLVPDDTGSVRHNGSRALPVNVLRIGDELRLGGIDLFVSRQRGQRVAPAGATRAGATCPLCRSEIAAEQRAYACPCGAVLHCDGDDIPEADRLACAELASACPVCSARIEFAEEGIAWLPEA